VYPRLASGVPVGPTKRICSSYAPVIAVTGVEIALARSTFAARNAAVEGGAPASRNTRTCCTASTLQPHASELPCSATASPSMMVVGSPSTMGNVPLCVGQLALSLTRATGLPSMSVKGEPLITCPPLLVASPTTAHILVMHPLHGVSC